MHRGPQAHTQSGIGGPVVHAPNAALLIDFDNVTMGIQKDLHAELRSLLSSDIIHGKVAVQRAYADWRRYPQYIVPLSEASIDLIFAPAYGSSKKNATDIRLAIDAIELVFTRPEIGTIILLSGDSDFSSLVIKLKEYGKYVIGVGIRESSSDLLVQNCDEYYSYNALAGLVKEGEGEGSTKYDPWELVTEAITRMQRNGDVMRSDRLKQVMQEIDNSFDEKNLGISKFSKFCLEAAQKGLIQVTKLENGQLDVAPPAGKAGKSPDATAATAAATAMSTPSARTPLPAGEGEEREGRRRGRRGGRGRNKRDREGTAGEAVVEAVAPIPGETVPVIAAPTVVTSVTPTAVVGAPFVPAPVSRPAVAERNSEQRPAASRAPHASGRTNVVINAPKADAGIGGSGLRLTRDEAFALIRRAVAGLVSGEDSVPSERVREKAFALLGRDSESLSERNFARILRDAHDADAVDLRKRGDTFEVATAASAPSVADQLNVKEAALKAAADKEKAANAPIVPRGMGARGAPARGGRSGFSGKALPPVDLMIGVVDDAPAPPVVVDESKPARKSRARPVVADGTGEDSDNDKPKRPSRAKKAITPA